MTACTCLRCSYIPAHQQDARECTCDHQGEPMKKHTVTLRDGTTVTVEAEGHYSDAAGRLHLEDVATFAPGHWSHVVIEPAEPRREVKVRVEVDGDRLRRAVHECMTVIREEYGD